MKIEKYETVDGVKCIMVIYEDGTIWSGLESAWDELQTAKENGTIS